MADCTPSGIIGTEAEMARIDQVYPQVQTVALDRAISSNLSSNAAIAATGDDLAMLQYTSGSTGNPKGVRLTHRNILSNLAAIQKSFGLSAKSKAVSWLPLFHDMGLIGGMLQTVYTGYSTHLLNTSKFLRNPLRWLECISNRQAVTSGGPNFGYDLCIKAAADRDLQIDLRSWTVAFNGSEAVRADTLRTFAQLFHRCGFNKAAFRPCYGLAEATLLVSVGEVPMQNARQGEGPGDSTVGSDPALQNSGDYVSVGKPISGLRVVISNDTGEESLPDGAAGEICIAGPSVTDGYWSPHSIKTNELFTLAGSLQEPLLRTGDLGFVVDGELYVTGRKKGPSCRGRKEILCRRHRSSHPRL